MIKNKPAVSKQQKGQALVLSVFLVLATAMTTVLMYNNGQTTTEKTRLVNAADAAAYSGAVFVARSLNFYAYTNRAMIANHVAVGHFVSYVSWLRYVEDSVSELNNYTRFIPYIGPAVAYVDKVMGYLKQGTEKVAPFIVQGADALNTIIHAAQKLSQVTMSGVMSLASVSSLLKVKIMDKVAKSYDPNIRVNYTKDVNTTGGKIAALQVGTDIKKTLQYIKKYKIKNDKGRMKQMVENSYDISRPWIEGNRGWGVNLVAFKLNKDGSTSHTMSKNKSDWEAKDTLVYKWWTVKGWKSTTVGKGEASATEFSSKYKGIPGYYDLRKPGKDSEQILNISALATMPISSTRFMQLMGMKPGAQRLAALSRAEIFHNKPEKGFSKLKNGEYSNLYNPFWQVRLTKNQI